MATSVLSAMMPVPQFMGQGMIQFGQKPVPEPGPRQVLIQVKANALCGSERGQWLHGSAVTPGHEAAGVVVAAGPDTHIPVGTPGVVFLMDFCGTCRSCRLGLTNQCLRKRADMGFTHDGGYGPYQVIHESIFFPVDPDLPFADATMLLDVMGTSAHALKRAQLVHPDIQSLLVMGAGPVGLGMLAIAKVLWGDALPVLIADLVPYRLALAERLGGTPLDLQQHTLSAAVHGAGLDDTVDLAVDTSGKRAARQASIAVLARRGVLVCVGHGEELTLAVSSDLIAPERAVLGSEYFPFSDLPSNLALLREHRAYLAQIITHRFAVGDIQQAFELFWGGNTGKVVIEHA